MGLHYVLEWRRAWGMMGGVCGMGCEGRVVSEEVRGKVSVEL